MRPPIYLGYSTSQHSRVSSSGSTQVITQLYLLYLVIFMRVANSLASYKDGGRKETIASR